MGLATYIAFVVISLGVLIFPGPSILLIVANSLQRGRVIGLYTVFGGFWAMLAQLTFAIGGLNSIDALSAAGFEAVRWAGVAFLVYIGVQRWRGSSHGEVRGRVVTGYRSAIVEGFVVALTNPGTLLFFVAFFPQFVNNSADVFQQLLLLGATFMVLTVIVDSGYAWFAALDGDRLHKKKQRQARQRVAGALLIVAAVALAVVNL
jgi:homoserine/homoserine lactone efflux protein